MAKKKKDNDWVAPLIIVVVILGIFIASTFDFSSTEVNAKTENNIIYDEQIYAEDNYEFERVSEEHSKYIAVAEKERNEAEASIKCFEAWDSELELSNCISNSRIALSQYESKLNDLRNFLEENGGVFTNRIKLISLVDDEIAWVYQTEASIENFVVQYNAQIETQQNQQALSQAREEAVYDTLSLLTGLPI